MTHDEIMADLHRRLLAEWAMSARTEPEREVIEDWRRILASHIVTAPRHRLRPGWTPVAPGDG